MPTYTCPYCGIPFSSAVACTGTVPCPSCQHPIQFAIPGDPGGRPAQADNSQTISTTEKYAQKLASRKKWPLLLGVLFGGMAIAGATVIFAILSLPEKLPDGPVKLSVGIVGRKDTRNKEYDDELARYRRGEQSRVDEVPEFVISEIEDSSGNRMRGQKIGDKIYFSNVKGFGPGTIKLFHNAEQGKNTRFVFFGFRVSLNPNGGGLTYALFDRAVAGEGRIEEIQWYDQTGLARTKREWNYRTGTITTYKWQENEASKWDWVEIQKSKIE